MPFAGFYLMVLTSFCRCCLQQKELGDIRRSITPLSLAFLSPPLLSPTLSCPPLHPSYPSSHHSIHCPVLSGLHLPSHLSLISFSKYLSCFLLNLSVHNFSVHFPPPTSPLFSSNHLLFKYLLSGPQNWDIDHFCHMRCEGI